MHVRTCLLDCCHCVGPYMHKCAHAIIYKQMQPQIGLIHALGVGRGRLK
jgi:hypothetical protein